MKKGRRYGSKLYLLASSNSGGGDRNVGHSSMIMSSMVSLTAEDSRTNRSRFKRRDRHLALRKKEERCTKAVAADNKRVHCREAVAVRERENGAADTLGR